MTEIEFSKTEFAPCANLRLYIPELLPKNKSRVVYIDTDVLFLGNTGSIFSKVFHKMEQNKKMIALTTENKNDDISYYFKYSALPSLYYGLNSGIIFMNLHSMRKYLWTDRVRLIFSLLGNSLVFSDQDIFNFLFFLQPNVFLELHCNYNFRPDHCYSRQYFTTSKEKGVIMHGSRSAFHNIDLNIRTLRMFKWFLSSLINNPLLFLYSIKVIHINAEFDFFRMVYRSVDKATPIKSHIKELSKALKSATACSEFKNFLLHSIKMSYLN
nr:glucoside xylosyltransferase 2-like isoform X3 [Lepeophtheirus salmonis]